MARTTTSRSKRSTGRRLTAAERLAIVEAYRQGRSYAEIEERFDVGHNTIARLTKGECPRRVRALTDDRCRVIAAAYQAGATYSELAKQFGTGKEQVAKALAQMAVTPRRPISRLGRRKAPANEIVEEIISLYISGASQAEVVRRLHVSPTTVSRVLNEAGVPRHRLSELHARRYPVDHDAFADLDDETAYWVGFLMADGCITSSTCVQLSSHVRDLPHLRRFLRFVGSQNRPIAVRGNTAVASVHSGQIVDDLASCGVVPRKSYGAVPSPAVAKRPSFWLGLIDGDGTVGISRAPYISLCGSRSLLEHYTDFLAATILVGRRQRITTRRLDDLCFVTVEGRTARLLAELLYGASPVCLPRKADKAGAALRYRTQTESRLAA